MVKINLKRTCNVIAFVSIVVGLTTGSVSPVWAKDHLLDVIPPHAKPFGITYEEWIVKWWQWALALPVDQNPFFDEGGNCAHGANGQLGPVWYLTGVINQSGTAIRNCTVPAGKALFFPIINVECSTLEAPPFYGANRKDLRDCAQSFRIADVFATIDGVEVEKLKHYRVESPLFTFTVPPNNTLGVTPGTGQSIANGYYLMLAPLPAGRHTIHFGGSFPDFPFSLDITYNLTVGP